MIRLREQQKKLLDDKIYLADSIADISHQIRTPLTSINLLCEFLSEEQLSDAITEVELDNDREAASEPYLYILRVLWISCWLKSPPSCLPNTQQ